MSAKELGLSLSGGGYRAAAFHLGTLKKLNELGILEKVDVISTISGGSITGAAWLLHHGDYDSFHQEMVSKLTSKSVIRYIFVSWIFIRTILFMLLFIGGAVYVSTTSFSYLTIPLLIVFFILLFRYQYKIFPVSRVIEKAYDDFFYKGKTLKALKPKPILAIGSSNLHTGRPFTFSQIKMSDSTYVFREEYDPPIKFLHDGFPVARAVMASSSVPFAFTPVRIDEQFFQDKADFKRVTPVLVDGGVYDNQGIQKLAQDKSTYECNVIITSDAGGNFIADKKYPNALVLLTRTVDLFMYRIKAFQMVQNIYHNVKGAAKPISYYSLGWEIKRLIPGFIQNMIEGQVLRKVIDAHGFPKEWTDNPKDYKKEIEEHLKKNISYEAVEKRNLTNEEWIYARESGTNLKSFSTRRVECLIRHSENLTELQIKLYCPHLISTV